MPIFTLEGKLSWLRHVWADQLEQTGYSIDMALKTLMYILSIKACEPIHIVTQNNIMNLEMSMSSLIWQMLFLPSLFHHPGRLWGAADLPSAFRPVVYSWSDQLGTWMWANWFSRGLHSSDFHQEMDIYIPVFLGRQNKTKQKKRELAKTLQTQDTMDPPATPSPEKLYCTRTQRPLTHSFHGIDLLVMGAVCNTVQSPDLGISSFIIYRRNNCVLWMSY